MFQIKNMITIYSFLAVVSGASVKLPNQCSITDGECKRLMYQGIIRQLLEGNVDKNIPQADPMKLTNSVFTLPNSVKLTLEEGVVTGFKNCDFVKMETYMEEKFHSTLNLTCDIKTEGKYMVEVPKDVMKELGGEDINADIITGSGKGKVTMERLHLFLYIPFALEWRNNEVYMHGRNLSIFHDVHESVVFSIEELDVGNKVNGEKIANYLKEKAIELDLIAPISVKMLEFFEAFVENFLVKIPAKNLFSGDLARFI